MYNLTEPGLEPQTSGNDSDAYNNLVTCRSTCYGNTTYLRLLHLEYFRFYEEEREKDRAELQRSARRIREEIDDKVEESVQILDSTHTEAVEDMKELYQMKESNQKRLSTLKEVEIHCHVFDSSPIS